MPSFNDLKLTQSRFCKSTDFRRPQLVTLEEIGREVLGRGTDAKPRAIGTFAELQKPVILNTTNFKKMLRMHNLTEGDDFAPLYGKQFVLYYDEDVEFGTDIVGGLKVRAPKNREQGVKEVMSKPVAVREPGEDEEDSDVGF